MKRTIMVTMGFLLLAIAVLSLSAYKQNQENAKFKRGGEVFNNKENTEIRAQRLAEEEAAAAKKKAEEAQDKGEGQVKVKF